MYCLHSSAVSASCFSTLIQYVVESRGIGTIPCLSIKSPKSDSSHFIPVLNGPSIRVPQKILFPIEKHKSVPYFMSSVVCGHEMQIFLKSSIVILMIRECFTITANDRVFAKAWNCCFSSLELRPNK